MPEIISFKEMIEVNGVPFNALIAIDGQYINGKWVQGGHDNVQMKGVILPLSNDDLKYVESGTYTVKEKKLLTTEPIDIGTQIDYKNDVYTLQAFKDYTEYTDVHIYLMRWREGVDGS
ncbi:hypothetical protein [Psychrobacillus vulpis]|uniref:Uncharacterized protein n=1 Tax=Psychrobacillus vulpis TaxID=2325572 RepID=A0A544TWI8_9BACI|nr:hypothetical protein [Psychrobacillus vulpis]TQR21800.1 hypothetical protein FG384_02310 [Psychrobacillus vulpis]